MVDKSELLRVPAFADLPDDQLDWFLGQAAELHVKAGDTYFHEGDPADAMFVILEGQLQGRGDIGGETVCLPDEARRRHRRAALFSNEAIYGGRARHYRRDASCVFPPLSFPTWCRRCRN